MSPAIDDYEKSFAPEPGQGKRRKMIKHYAPKGGTVEAILIQTDNLEEAAKWCGGEVRDKQHHDSIDTAWDRVVLVPSLQGGLEAPVGTYLVREDNKFRVEYSREFEERYKEVGLRQDGIHFKGNARGGIISRETGPVAINRAGGSGEAYGDYPDYRFQIPDPSIPRGDSVQPKGWGLNSDCP